MGRVLVLASCILPHLNAKVLSVFILNEHYLATVPLMWYLSKNSLNFLKERYWKIYPLVSKKIEAKLKKNNNLMYYELFRPVL